MITKDSWKRLKWIHCYFGRILPFMEVRSIQLYAGEPQKEAALE